MGEFRRENVAVKKGGKISPGEISAEQFHTSPQLQGLCLLRRAKRAYKCARANRFLRRCMKSGAADPSIGACKPKRWQPHTLCDAHAVLQIGTEAKGANLETTMEGLLLFSARSSSATRPSGCHTCLCF